MEGRTRPAARRARQRRLWASGARPREATLVHAEPPLARQQRRTPRRCRRRRRASPRGAPHGPEWRCRWGDRLGSCNAQAQCFQEGPQVRPAHGTQRATPEPWLHATAAEGVATGQPQGLRGVVEADGALFPRNRRASPLAHGRLDLTRCEATHDPPLALLGLNRGHVLQEGHPRYAGPGEPANHGWPAGVEGGPSPLLHIGRDDVRVTICSKLLHTKATGAKARLAAKNGRLLTTRAPFPAISVETLCRSALELHDNRYSKGAEWPTATITPVAKIPLVHWPPVGLAAGIGAWCHLLKVCKLRNVHCSRPTNMVIEPPILKRLQHLPWCWQRRPRQCPGG